MMSALIFVLGQVLVIGAIILWERRRNPMPTDWQRNLQAWGLDVGASLLIAPLFHDYVGKSLIDGTSLPFLIAFPLFFVIRDATEFFWHFCQHKIGFLWRMHSLHHSDPEMSVLTANRHFWGEQVFSALTIWPLTTMIISQSKPMLAAFAVCSLYNYFIHSNLKFDFGRWSWLLTSPAYHRRHHSRLREHYDSNFAVMLPIFDVLCGTYHRPEGWPPTGLEREPQRFLDLVIWPVEPTEPEPQPAMPAA